MPAHRRGKYSCAYDDLDLDLLIKLPRERKPRKLRKDMTEEEKAQADAERDRHKVLAEKKKAWEATLVPWKTDQNLRWPVGTVAMYKSDAKSSFGLTDTEMLTLPYESIMMSSKTFFRVADVKALAARKYDAGVLKPGMSVRGEPLDGKNIGTFTKSDHNLSYRTRKNWSPSGYNLMRSEFGFGRRRY